MEQASQGIRDALGIIETSLAAYFSGRVYMYKAVASQLRILYCDSNRGKDNSLLQRLKQEVRLPVFKPIVWESMERPGLSWSVPAFRIIRKANGIEFADFDVDTTHRCITLNEWRSQQVCCSSAGEISVQEIIRNAADKDGGAHLDETSSETLSFLKGFGPTQHKANILFVVGLARFTLKFVGPLFDEAVKGM